MALTKIKIGELVTLNNTKNTAGLDLLFYGINRDKVFMPTVAAVDGLDKTKYKVITKGIFVFSGMQTGRDQCIRIGQYNLDFDALISPAYTTFDVTSDKIIPEYFFMLFKSSEMDRYGAFLSDGSIRSNLDWEVFCDIELSLPPIEIQEKYVAIYNAMLANQKAYESGLDDLKLLCDAYIENLRKVYEPHRIGDYIKLSIEKNTDGSITLEQGINIDKKFITPQRSNANLTGRRIVRTGQFAYCTQLNNENVAIAYRYGPDCVVSSVYDVFEITETDELNSSYLMLWLIRSEFGRYVYWASVGSAYEFLDYKNIADYLIPVPSMQIQESIANIYNVYTKRKEINEQLKEQIKDLCPILIKGSIEESKDEKK